jgi:hypothetical protein
MDCSDNALLTDIYTYGLPRRLSQPFPEDLSATLISAKAWSLAMSHKINQQEDPPSDSDMKSYRSFPDVPTSKSNSDSSMDTLPSPPSDPDISEEDDSDGDGDGDDDFDWNSLQILASVPFALRANSTTARILICANALAFTVSDEAHFREHVHSLQRPAVLPVYTFSIYMHMFLLLTILIYIEDDFVDICSMG